MKLILSKHHSGLTPLYANLDHVQVTSKHVIRFGSISLESASSDTIMLYLSSDDKKI